MADKRKAERARMASDNHMLSRHHVVCLLGELFTSEELHHARDRLMERYGNDYRISTIYGLLNDAELGDYRAEILLAIHSFGGMHGKVPDQ